MMKAIRNNFHLKSKEFLKVMEVELVFKHKGIIPNGMNSFKSFSERIDKLEHIRRRNIKSEFSSNKGFVHKLCRNSFNLKSFGARRSIFTVFMIVTFKHNTVRSIIMTIKMQRIFKVVYAIKSVIRKKKQVRFRTLFRVPWINRNTWDRFLRD